MYITNEINWENLDYKLIDFGNSVIINENDYEYDDLYYRNYRSPEIIMSYTQQNQIFGVLVDIFI